MDILIYYEHKAREMAVISALAALLENVGKRVKIAHLYHDTDVFRVISPKIVLIPFFYGDYDETLKKIFNHYSGPILNLAFEQILYGIQKQVKEPRNIALSGRVHHCAWSQAFADFLQAAGVSSHCIVRIGNPNFALADEPYITIEPSRKSLAAASGLDLSKRWVLFTENYRWAFITSSQINRFVNWGGDRKGIEDAVEYCRKSLCSIILEIRRLAQEGFFRNHELIFRLRPSTQRNLLDKFLNENGLSLPKEILINKNFNARAWIRHSDLVVSSFSTTICDASLMMKPIFLYSPYPYPDSLKYDWTNLVENVDSLDPAVLFDTNRGSPEKLSSYIRKNYLSYGDPIENLKEACLHISDGVPAQRSSEIVDCAKNFWFEATRVMHRVLYPVLCRNTMLDQKWRITPYLNDLITVFDERRMLTTWRKVLSL